MLRPYPSDALLPLKDDGCGNCDAVFVEPGPGAREGINPVTKQRILLLAQRTPPPPRSS